MRHGCRKQALSGYSMREYRASTTSGERRLPRSKTKQVNKEEMMLRDNWWTEKEKESEKYKRLRKVSPDWTMSKIRSRTIMQTTPVILQLRSPNAITRTSPSVPSTPLVTKANARAQDTAQDQALMVNPSQEPRRGLAKEEVTMRKAPNESGLWTC